MPTLLQNFLTLHLGTLPAPAQAVAAAARGLQPAAGEALLRAGGRWSQLFWVEQGALRWYDLDRQGRASTKNFHLDGAMLWPLTPALAGAPVDFWVEAIGRTRVWALPWQALERRTLAALLDDKMRRAQQFLQCTAAQRDQALCAARPDWLQRVPLRHLACDLGTTDVALSGIRRRLNPA